jgi:YHS domain-containing protein
MSLHTIPRRLVACARALVLLVLGATLAGCQGLNVMNTVSDGADAKLMLAGNDPVAYHTAGKPVKGSPAIKAEHQGLTYRFATEDNRKSFVADPGRYAPAYGGFCASGAPYALKAAIGADTFKIVDRRLYLFGSERSRRHWEMDEKQNIALGDSYWEKETKDVPYRLQNARRYVFRVPHYKTDAELEAEWQCRYGSGAAKK